MKTIANLLRRLLSRKQPLRVKPAQMVLGSGDEGIRVMRLILAATRPDAIRARQNNYRRSVKRILDSFNN